MIYLTNIEPPRNMARFYALDIEPTLFGQRALVKNWGRIGTAGRSLRVAFAREADAQAALGQELKRRAGQISQATPLQQFRAPG